MSMTKLKPASGILAVSLLIGGVGWLPAMAQPGQANVNGDTFAQLQKQIKPQPGESRWMDVPWFLDLHAARQKAAAEGKPLFIYSSGGATGIGAC